jgi:hypothetical protein
MPKQNMMDFIDGLPLEGNGFNEQVKIMSDKVREMFGTLIFPVKSSSIYIPIEIPDWRNTFSVKKESIRKFVCLEREQFPEEGYSISIRYSNPEKPKDLAIALNKKMLKGADSARSLLKMFVNELKNIMNEEITSFNKYQEEVVKKQQEVMEGIVKNILEG